MRQAGLPARRQVRLGEVAGDHGPGTEADARQKHLHLLHRRVLGFVEYNERFVERAAAHVRKRRDFDDVAVDEAPDVLETHHFVERVIDRPQVGVHLLRQVAWEESEPFAGLHRGPNQDDAPHHVRVQGFHGRRHGQVGLAGARGADAEDQILAPHGARVGGLVGSPGADFAPPGVEDRGFPTCPAGAAEAFLQAQVHPLGVQMFALGQREQFLEHVLRNRRRIRLAAQPEPIAAALDANFQPLFDLPEMLVELPAEIGHAPVVVRAKDDFQGIAFAVQFRQRFRPVVLAGNWAWLR